MERHEHGLPRRQEFGLEAGPGDPMWGNPVADGDGAMKIRGRFSDLCLVT